MVEWWKSQNKLHWYISNIDETVRDRRSRIGGITSYMGVIHSLLISAIYSIRL